MVNALSALTAIVVYARICELGYGNGAAIACGVIKKSAGAATPNGQNK